MRYKFEFASILFILMVLFAGISVTAQDSIVDSNIPESWNQAPKTASEMGIASFSQSPMLEKRVDRGELPALEERLAVDPPVIEPYEQVGTYGGRFEVHTTELGNGFGQFMRSFTAPLSPGPDGESVIPWYAESYEYSDGYTEITLRFREGLKWSDGEPFIPEEEYKFWWDYVTDEELSPLGGRKVGEPEITELSFPDENTVTFHMEKPFPLKHKADFRFTWALGNMEGTNIAPKHVMKKYHPDYVDEEEILEKLDDLGFESIYDGFNELWAESSNPTEPDYNIPTLAPYVPVEETETHLLYERNPYYPFIDNEGNQLPYVDEMRYNLVNNITAGEIKAITGDATVAGYQILSVENMPSYIENEEQGDYRTIILSLSDTAYPYYFFNFNHENSSFAEVVNDKRFRQAVSMAIDREDINQKVYFGEGVPMQATIPSTNEYFKEEYAKSYAEYDPDRAKELLDEMGMVDNDEDGFREAPDGEKFSVQLQKPDPNHVGPISIDEMVKSKLAEVGIDMEIKIYDGSLVFDRIQGNEYEMESHRLNPTMPLIGPEIIKKIFAPVDLAWIAGPWVQWAIWRRSDGEQGMEPPEEVKDLISSSEKYLYGETEEEREAGIAHLLESQAENLWGIGTVAHPPQPIIVKNSVKNVPESGYSSWGLGHMKVYNPIQFYIEE